MSQMQMAKVPLSCIFSIAMAKLKAQSHWKKLIRSARCHKSTIKTVASQISENLMMRERKKKQTKNKIEA